MVRPLDVASLRMSAIARQLSTRAAPAWTAPDGYAYDSPIVTGNLKMFYRDGADRGDPYTWAEFLEHLARRVRADEQPRLVRAKYGVGFELAGGDMAQWAFDPARPGVTVTLHLDGGRRIEIPKAQLTAPLDDGEMHDYQRRLAALIGLGDAAPTAILSDAAATTLRRLGLLSIGSRGAADQNTATDDDLLAALGTDMGPGWGVVLSTGNARVRDALHAFRKLIGKAPPDDPAQADLLLPAERAALEVYGMRIERLVAAANGGDE